MSKFVKKMQMDHLRREFAGVDEMLVVSVVGMDAIENHSLRSELRKRGIRLQVVSNALAQKVFAEQGLDGLGGLLDGPSAIAWGGEGVVELAKEITDWARKFAKFRVKGGCVSGQTINVAGVTSLSQLPSREEMLGRIVGQALGPASAVIAQAIGPAARVVGQVKSIAEGDDEE